eukprot:05829.XXX_90430_88990_1 [CDS] Oithona nana genome sequencing.
MEQKLKALSELQQKELALIQEIQELKVSEASETLNNDEIGRYSRQLLLPEWGVQTQLNISKKTKGVLVIGAGGLGCPAVQFLAAAGLSPIGIVDYDEVSISNLHRQVLHTEQRQNMSKVDSIILAVKQLNSNVKIVPYYIALDSTNALDIIEKYDVILDASDNVATRYLLNDACVLANKPLVSGSALRFDGQLTVYNYKNGPTYRCLYPEPPPPETVTNCSDGGVVGVVCGVIGTLQAQEALKIIGEFGDVLSGKMLLYDALSTRFTTVKLRPRKVESEKIDQLIDYEQFCGAKATDKDLPLELLDAKSRISVQDYVKLQKDFVLIDVRTEPEMDICQLENSLNIPLNDIPKEKSVTKINQKLTESSTKNLILVCRKGNDSQKAVKILEDKLPNDVIIKDILGGLYAYAEEIDDTFPKY